MLVLVAGATGSLGQKIVDGLLSRGQQVRALGRNPSKMEPSRRKMLEDFITSSGYDDIPALDRACAGADAIICTYQGIPILQLEGQLLLLRAAERAGVKRFITSTFNYNWRDNHLGHHESYDGFIAFRNHVEKTSDIRPIYLLTGILAEVLFCSPNYGQFTPENHGVWDPVKKKMNIWGTGNEIWYWTTEKDAAEFAAEVILQDTAPEGGFWTLCSGTSTLRELAITYEQVRGIQVEIDFVGSVDDLRARALSERAKGTKRHFWTYIGWFYQLHTVDGTWKMPELDNGKVPNVQATTFEQFLRENPAV